MRKLTGANDATSTGSTKAALKLHRNLITTLMLAVLFVFCQVDVDLVNYLCFSLKIPFCFTHEHNIINYLEVQYNTYHCEFTRQKK